MAVKHAFTSAVADGADTSVVRPSNWNADHNAMPFRVSLQAGTTALASTNAPAALTEFSSALRVQADLTYATDARLLIRLTPAGFAGSELRAQYSLNAGSSWAYLDGAAGPAVSLTTAGNPNGAWVALEAAAKADVLLRVITISGDGVADPTFYQIALEFR